MGHQPAHQQHQRDRDRSHPFHAGEIPGVDQVGSCGGLLQLVAALVDRAPRMAERRKGLQHPDALDVIDDDPVQAAELVAVAHESLVGRATEGHEDEQDDGQRGERHQRQLPVEEQHQDAQQKGNGGGTDQLDAGVRGEEFDGLDVADHLGRDRPGLLARMESHRKSLQLLVDPHPHVVQDLEGGDMAEPALEVAGDGHERRGAEHGDAEQDEGAGG